MDRTISIAAGPHVDKMSTFIQTRKNCVKGVTERECLFRR
jgi:hypothetical protein